MRFFWTTYMEHKVIFGFMVLVLFAAIGAGLVKLVTSPPAPSPVVSKSTVVKTASSSPPVTPASTHPVRTHHHRHRHVVLTPSPVHSTYAYSPSPAPAPVTRSPSPAPTRTHTVTVTPTATPTPARTPTPAPTVTITPTPVVTTPAGSPPAT